MPCRRSRTAHRAAGGGGSRPNRPRERSCHGTMSQARLAREVWYYERYAGITELGVDGY
ncbi:hypothetical protein [Streptomyces bungoensis]|uniref:hypothetical protein n=1 Tax=Streptomyces bungoensis TaxID=285568 RepID=UPI003407493A